MNVLPVRGHNRSSEMKKWEDTECRLWQNEKEHSAGNTLDAPRVKEIGLAKLLGEVEGQVDQAQLNGVSG